MFFKLVLKQLITYKTVTMSIFTQRLNPITGQMAWEIQSENYNFHQEVARAAYADMLHDYERNEKYEAALKVAIDRMHSQGKKANVLDIGTGTGLLSMMAVRHGADSVVACEAFNPMGECAKKVIDENGFSGKIKVIPKRSTDIKIGVDMDFKANILVTEVFDTELIGEGAFGTFKNAHNDLLEKDCIVIPHNATMYVQVVESPFINNWNRLKDVYDEEGVLLLTVPETVKNCKGTAAVHDLQLNNIDKNYFNTIISPKPIFKFDWSGKSPFIFDRSNVQTFQAERDGIAHAVFMWWELDMDIDDKIKLSCAPYWVHPLGDKAPWRDHWMQAIYYFPSNLKVWKGEDLQLISCHDEYSLWFNIKKDNITETDYQKPLCDCSLHDFYSRTRIGQMNDPSRTKKFASLFQKHITKESVVLVLSNGFYQALAAAKLGAKNVVFVEPNWSRNGSNWISLIKSFIECNDLKNIEILPNAELKSRTDIKFNLIVGEPYFISAIVPWDNLQFAYQLGEYKEMFSEDVKVFPSKAIIRGVAVEFEHLYKIRSPLGTCEGFKMDSFDCLIQHSSSIADDVVDAEPLWEYKGKAMSEIVDIATLDIPNLCAQEVATSGSFNLTGSGECNGLALWVDWIFDEEENIKISSGPTETVYVNTEIQWNIHVRQGVHLMRGKKCPGNIGYSFKFDNKLGVIKFKTQL
nr:protein arginine N-methyltransferase 7-like [Onthophagus taurus]